MENHSSNDQMPKFWGSKYSIGYLVLGAVAAYFLLTEHYAHTIAALPFLLFLACPLMHIFMHHGHHHGSNNGKPQNPESDKKGANDD